VAKKTAKKTPKTARGAKKAARPSSAGAGRDGGRRAQEAGPMSLPLLEQLVKLMSANELTNIELQDGEQRIVLSRGGQPVAMAQAPAAPAAQVQAASASPAPTPSGEAPASTSSTAGLTEIKSPMVGTFYVSPSPDAKAFVQVGDKVGPDTDVCIIEAMKVFNNIKAETSGTIEKLLVESGSAVEYGQALFLVKPA
jgi:acetyl-CoA carboxylase biotin carboxyl carrier protein